MMRALEIWRLLLLGMASVLVAGMAAGEALARDPENVILVTLDGVRWEDLFGGQPALAPRAFDELKDRPHSFLIGDHSNGEKYPMISNPSQLSLPAYQTIFTGRYEGCVSNSCGNVKSETLQEGLLRAGLNRESVISLASWEVLARAVEHRAGATLHSIGKVGFPLELLSPQARESVGRINAVVATDLPSWGESRKDLYTKELALAVLADKKPRFLYVGLVDTDEWGHEKAATEYAHALRESVSFIQQIERLLAESGEYGARTTLIVTTDHGRGKGGDWKNHGELRPESAAIWLYARGPHVRTGRAPRRFEHFDLRPTIEKILGVASPDDLSGQVIREISGD